MIAQRRFLAAGVAVVALAVLAAPVLGLKIGQSSSTSLARGGPAFEALQVLEDGGVGTGVLTPITVIVPTDQTDRALQAVDGVDGVLTAAVSGQAGATSTVQVLPSLETVDRDGTAVVERVRQALSGAVDGAVGITGPGATVEGYGSAVYDNFPYVLALISVITFLLRPASARGDRQPGRQRHERAGEHPHPGHHAGAG